MTGALVPWLTGLVLSSAAVAVSAAEGGWSNPATAIGLMTGVGGLMTSAATLLIAVRREDDRPRRRARR